MTQYSGVYTLQAQGQALTSGQWATDPYYKNTTLLLHADGVGNGAQNNSFIDSSTNSFAITRNGNTTQGSFTPYGPTWSNYFDGSGDYLTSTVASVGSSGDLTVEGWVYPTASGVRRTVFFIGNTGTYDLNFFTEITAANVLRFLMRNDSVTDILDISSTATVSANAWSHVAFVLSGTSASIYLNGTSVATGTLSGSRTGTFTTGSVGALLSGGATHYFTGYLSNLRYVKGTAVYTSAFNPPTAPLTAITNTSLLTCQSNRFVDNSVSSVAITAYGNTSVQRFSPFAPQYQYTPAVIGGAAYFDGTGDYLAVGGTPANFGSSDFLIEGWIYMTGTGGGYPQFFSSNVTTDLQFAFTSNTAIYFYDGTTYSASYTFNLNSWYHVAWSRVSGTMRIFVNGAQVLSFSYATAINFGTSAAIGGYNGGTANGAFQGYISDVKVVNGTGATTITVPTAPESSSGATILVSMTNAGIYDNAMMNDLETVGNAQVSTSVVKYGSGSLAFDGSGDYLVSNPASTDLYAFGTGDFTIEFWLYLNTVSGTQIVYDCRPTGTNGAQPIVFVDAGVVKFQHTSSVRITGPSLVTGTWYHISVARSGTNTKMFVNGIQGGSTYSSDTTAYTNSSQRPIIGVDAANTSINPLNGYIDDLRITKGVARYTANFQPPKVAFANQ